MNSGLINRLALHPHILSIAMSGSDIVITYLGANGDTSYAGGPTSRTNVLEFTAGSSNGSYTNNFASTGVSQVLSNGTGTGVVSQMTEVGGATNTPARYYRVRIIIP